MSLIKIWFLFGIIGWGLMYTILEVYFKEVLPDDIISVGWLLDLVIWFGGPISLGFVGYLLYKAKNKDGGSS